MAQVLFDAVVETDYGQFDISWGDGIGFDGDFDRYFGGQVNGLAGATSGDGLYLNLARRSGGSPVRIVQHDDEPPQTDEWQDVVEVSITVPEDAEVRWSSWAGEDGGPLSMAPGTYRVRVNARGRDAGRDGEFADGPVDFYLAELWPSETRPDAVLRTGSEDAVYWHNQVGSRR
jgi:hypothetical protein